MSLTGFLYALLTVFAASFGARDQLLVRHLATAQARRPLVLVVALVAAGGTCALAAWVGGRMLAGLPSPARGLFAAIALVMAGGEMLVLRARGLPDEPTRSLFATWLVLTALQSTDAARFLVLALAVGSAAPVSAGLGGAVGSMAALAAAWSAPELSGSPGMMRARRVAGGVLLLLGLVIGIPNVLGIDIIGIGN